VKLKIEGLKVDVRDSKCRDRKCFRLGFDKGHFSQGRGYTSYHRDAKGRRVEHPVCMTRHLHGCPESSYPPDGPRGGASGPGGAEQGTYGPGVNHRE
jgi:hypothetical protein